MSRVASYAPTQQTFQQPLSVPRYAPQVAPQMISAVPQMSAVTPGLTTTTTQMSAVPQLTTTQCTTVPVKVPVCKTVCTGNDDAYDVDWQKYGSYAGYGGVGIGVIVFILLVIAVIVLWIRIRDMSEESREALVISYTGSSGTCTLPVVDRNIVFINQTKCNVILTVYPKDDKNNSGDLAPGGDLLTVKNICSDGSVKISNDRGLSYSGGGIDDGKYVTGTIASEFVWTNNYELLRLT